MMEKIMAWLDHANAVVEECKNTENPKEYLIMLGLVSSMIYELIEVKGIENMIFYSGLSEENAAIMFQLWEELNKIISKEEGS